MLKRSFDVVCSLAALILLSPVLAIAALVLSVTGEHRVLFLQERVGRGGKNFSILKFATMLKNSPNMSGGDITGRNDPRVLKVGRVLRMTKINELPQLFNILFGDMSIIGPRPLTPRLYARLDAGYRAAIADVRPGLSGIGSIFFRDEERLLLSSSDRDEIYFGIIQPYKAALETWYAAHQSFWVDLKLIMWTVLAVFRGDNVGSLPFADLPTVPPALADLMERTRRNAP